MVKDVHAKIVNETSVVDWPLCVPEAYRDQLKGRHGMRDKLGGDICEERFFMSDERAVGA